MGDDTIDQERYIPQPPSNIDLFDQYIRKS